MAIRSQNPSSGLSFYYRDDIANALRAVDVAKEELLAAINAPEMEPYRQGYEAALRATAEAFGLTYDRPHLRVSGAPTVIDIAPEVVPT
jgi:hypothetical protein